MLWIFKVAKWTRNKCTKINKSLTVSNGIRASSFEIWAAYLVQSLTVGTLTKSRSFICKVGYPVGIFFLNAFIFAWKKSKPVGYTRTMYSQTGKNMKWAETFFWCLLLIFKVVGDSGGVVNSLDFYPALIKSLGCFYFRCVLSSQRKAVTANFTLPTLKAFFEARSHNVSGNKQ